MKVLWVVYSVIICVVLTAPLIVWLQTTDNPQQYFSDRLPLGQGMYVLSKLLGLYAITLLCIQITTGLLPGAQHRRVFHRYLGYSTFIVMLAHAGLFMLAVSSRNGEFTPSLLIPNLDGTYYHFGVTLGVVGLWGMLLIIYAGIRMLRGAAYWKWAHWIALAVFVFVFAHGLMIGTETRMGIYILFYWGLAASVLLALIGRILQKKHCTTLLHNNTQFD